MTPKGLRKHIKVIKWFSEQTEGTNVYVIDERFEYFTPNPSFDEDKTYIISDKYLEYRIAIAKGKKLKYQLYDREKNEFQWYPMTDINDPNDDFPCRIYTVDQNELQEMGYIRVNGIPARMKKDRTIEMLGNSFYEPTKDDEIQKYAPRKGEYGYFYNNKGFIIFSRFYKEIKNGYKTIENEKFKYFEPFCGVLPKILVKEF